jgi:hypothetical protein
LATKRQVTRLLRDLRSDEEAFEELADRLFAFKRTVYVETLQDLAELHGYDIEGDVLLSEAIYEALGDDAEAAARQILDSLDGDLTEFVERNRERPLADLLDMVDDWLDDRQDWKAEQVAVTEAYPAHADATLHFYRAAGIDPEFDFGGHGDADPECDVCRALVQTNPHPPDRVLAIGQPHIRCAQKWHPRDLDESALPDSIVLGAGDPSGIFTRRETFEQLHGGKSQAAEAIRSLA